VPLLARGGHPAGLGAGGGGEAGVGGWRRGSPDLCKGLCCCRPSCGPIAPVKPRSKPPVKPGQAPVNRAPLPPARQVLLVAPLQVGLQARLVAQGGLLGVRGLRVRLGWVGVWGVGGLRVRLGWVGVWGVGGLRVRLRGCLGGWASDSGRVWVGGDEGSESEGGGVFWGGGGTGPQSQAKGVGKCLVGVQLVRTKHTRPRQPAAGAAHLVAAPLAVVAAAALQRLQKVLPGRRRLGHARQQVPPLPLPLGPGLGVA
jgi:hypothetical protein